MNRAIPPPQTGVPYGTEGRSAAGAGEARNPRAPGRGKMACTAIRTNVLILGNVSIWILYHGGNWPDNTIHWLVLISFLLTATGVEA